jgi:integrase
MLNSRRESSIRVYSSHIRRWTNFCALNNWDTTYSTVPRVLQFLQTLVDDKFSYSSVNTAKSALNTCIILPQEQTLGLNKDVRLFLRGVFNIRPPLPKRTCIWDPDVILDLMRSREGPFHIPTGLLAKFLATLILLTTGQRPQIITALRINDLIVQKTTAVFTLQTADVKQGRPGYVPPVVSLRKYELDNKLCVYSHLTEYLKRTKLSRGQVQQLFITDKKPYHAIMLNTAARWIKDVLHMSGIDTGRYSAGSTRSASTSKAQAQGASINVILEAAGWTKRSTFAKYYSRTIVKDQDISDFVLPQAGSGLNQD